MKHVRATELPIVLENDTTYYVTDTAGKCRVHVVGKAGDVRVVTDGLDEQTDPGDLRLIFENGLI